MYRGPLKVFIGSERPYRLPQGKHHTVHERPMQMKTAGIKDKRNSNGMAVFGQDTDD